MKTKLYDHTFFSKIKDKNSNFFKKNEEDKSSNGTLVHRWTSVDQNVSIKFRILRKFDVVFGEGEKIRT